MMLPATIWHDGAEEKQDISYSITVHSYTELHESLESDHQVDSIMCNVMTTHLLNRTDRLPMQRITPPVGYHGNSSREQTGLRTAGLVRVTLAIIERWLRHCEISLNVYATRAVEHPCVRADELVVDTFSGIYVINKCPLIILTMLNPHF